MGTENNLIRNTGYKTGQATENDLGERVVRHPINETEEVSGTKYAQSQLYWKERPGEDKEVLMANEGSRIGNSGYNALVNICMSRDLGVIVAKENERGSYSQ